MGSALELSLAPLDSLRRNLLHGLGRWVRPFIVDREARVALFAAFVVTSSLAATLLFPLWLMALGPILVGVPHLLSDVRYLVVRPGLARRRSLWLWIGAPLLVAGALPGARWGLLAVAGALIAARGSERRRMIGIVLWLPVYWAALRAGWITDLVVAHLHNVVAIALWWWWRPRTDRVVWGIVGLFVAASVILLTGVGEPLLVWSQGMIAPRSGLRFEFLTRDIAPLKDPAWAVRLVMWYGFAQAVHYGVWLRLIPEDDRCRPTPRSFTATLRALRDDFGDLPLMATAALALGLAIWAAIDLSAARNGYLRAVLFHGYLEFAAIAFFWVEGWRPRSRSAPSVPSGSPGMPAGSAPAYS